MSLSGIGVSPELTEAFAQAVDSKYIRFLKVSINKGRSDLSNNYDSLNITNSIVQTPLNSSQMVL